MPSIKHNVDTIKLQIMFWILIFFILFWKKSIFWNLLFIFKFKKNGVLPKKIWMEFYGNKVFRCF